ncbi:ATP-binding cassette domain-containing protein [Halovivax sp.]|uniref:ATP-binding cassette domain-containing protein n=1 Tax=Halovivax sp. TaxID=1935978 RepID=UPI0025B8DF0C|nr:ATP-binding cassette domain-containing protein [Halovivax sp.]
MIDVEDVTISFGDGEVLADVSLTIPKGRFVGLVGPNGAGKTTLLRAISGALAPDRGSVRVDGVDVHDLGSRESSRLVSVVPQDTTVSFSFDVRHLVEMGRTPYRSRFSPPNEVDREMTDEALERTETAHLADRSIDEVSGGERQRVILARAVCQNTPVILLDEPTASLDVNHQVEMLGLVSELTADDKTAVAAIHDLDLAARFCDELAVLAGGTVVDRGPPERVLDESTIETAFDTTAAISTDPITATPRVTAIPTTESTNPFPKRVHVVGTGVPTASVLARLTAAGARCSLGPIPVDDAAAVAATHLDVDAITVEPFQSIATRHRAALADRLRSASVTVVVEGSSRGALDPIWTAIAEGSTAVVVVDGTTSDRPPCAALERLREGSVVAEPESVRRAVENAFASETDRLDVDRPADD